MHLKDRSIMPSASEVKSLYRAFLRAGAHSGHVEMVKFLTVCRMQGDADRVVGTTLKPQRVQLLICRQEVPKLQHQRVSDTACILLLPDSNHLC